MPKNTLQDQLQEKQAFLLELFRAQPNISRGDASDSYKDRFGAPLPPRLFNQMKEQVDTEQSQVGAAEGHAAAEEDAEQEEASAAAPARAADGASPAAAQAAAAAAEAAGGAPRAGKGKAGKAAAGASRHLFIDASRENLTFLEGIVAQLQAAGASNVRIDHSTERWMVLVVDAK
jgi:regulator of protease activity HflC (stomatin/prohibitin superfamily)